MNTNENAGSTRIVEHQKGKLLRLQTPGRYAKDTAAGLLGFMKAELDAEISATGDSRDGLNTAEPVAICLESLELELACDGSEIQLCRMGGSQEEFDDLCELIVAEYLHA